MGERVAGALLSPADPRDYQVASFAPVRRTFPAEFLEGYVPGPYDQGQSQMCVAFSCAEICEVQHVREGLIAQRLSPMWIYGMRQKGDYMGEGMNARDALKELVNYGIVPYAELPGVASFQEAYAKVQAARVKLAPEALLFRDLCYARCRTNAEVMTALMDLGPVLTIYGVTEGFEQTGSDGLVKSSGEFVGYHGMCVVGWEHQSGKLFWRVLNSWGESWGNTGRCLIPADDSYLKEFWSLTGLKPNRS